MVKVNSGTTARPMTAARRYQSRTARAIGHAAAPQADHPPANRGQGGDIEYGADRDDADHERSHAVTVAEGQRAAARARRRKLDRDEEPGGGDDGRRPGEVRGQAARRGRQPGR